ncbi:transmembrane protein 26-like isoform X1 [Mytilus edulis]|uniref:transmembrane protein 26-like isoform X1 n=1 Tax=Mytilus edulis TaxID=6550 RepID=UPI0039F088E1
MASSLTILRAVFVRLLFACHGLVSIWRLYYVTKDSRYWYLATSLGLLLVETTVTMVKKLGKEWKWFCPSVFIYMTSTVPAIWFLELHELDLRINHQISTNNTTAFNETLEALSANLGSILGVKLEIRLPILLSADQWIRTLEQILLLILIVGRWLLPKGKLTHDQLSQLLLVYIGTAADIVEFFEAFKEEQVRYNKLLCIIILGLWSLSLIQFTLVLTAARARRDQSGLVTRHYDKAQKTGCCAADVYGIFISIILQDAPFLVLRLLLIFKYGVLSYTNMFFTSKNSLVIVLLLYRLIVVYVEKNNTEVSDSTADSEAPRPFMSKYTAPGVPRGYKRKFNNTNSYSTNDMDSLMKKTPSNNKMYNCDSLSRKKTPNNKQCKNENSMKSKLPPDKGVYKSESLMNTKLLPDKVVYNSESLLKKKLPSNVVFNSEPKLYKLREENMSCGPNYHFEQVSSKV